MKPDIATMTLDELAEYVVTLDGWEWMKGIVDEDGDVMLGGTRMCYMTEGGYVCDEPACRPTPDLTDPATMGCLLAMVRKRYRVTITTEARPIDLTVKYRAIAARGRAESLEWAVYSKWMPTEAHALVAALAKEAI